ncbi:hypothetical protein JKP88DRAFT_230700 [Tribonema minus]|uniref:Tryptophan-rich sensory protein n=1 Tax=Tribonema minus TaxID=303371 RepID=A0A835ZJ92_9STRA|nr:hypothetical protein JKP88DRAFT_230700 [Tribonema minus]
MTSQADATPLLKGQNNDAGQPSPAAPRWLADRAVTANVVAFALNFAVVGASNFGLWGKTNKDVSDSIPTLTTPAAYAFSIWGLIFTSETALVVWQALPRNAGNLAVKQGLGPWFAAACVLQAVWSIAFAQEALTLSAVILVGIAVCLGKASANLAGFRARGAAWFDHLILHAPIGLHAGWTCAAALVNINLAAAQTSGVAAQVTAAIVTVFAAAAAAAVYGVVLLDPAFLAAVVWALAAIVANDGGYRDALLGKEVARGLTGAITVIWVGLLALQVVAVAARRLRK